jgi:hypothetical protein
MDNEFLRMLANAESDAFMPEGTRQEMIDNLQEAVQKTLNTTCLFSIGDIVTPRKDSNIKGRGRPHLVVDVFPLDIESPANSRTGAPCNVSNMRVAVLMRGKKTPLIFDAVHNDYEYYE